MEAGGKSNHAPMMLATTARRGGSNTSRVMETGIQPSKAIGMRSCTAVKLYWLGRSLIEAIVLAPCQSLVSPYHPEQLVPQAVNTEPQPDLSWKLL